MAPIINRLEIDVMQANELVEASEITVKNKLPGMVVHQTLMGDAQVIRGRLRGQFKLIVPIDWPKGATFGMTKMRGLNTDSFEADGFEILLTPGKNTKDTRNEAKALIDFIRTHISDQVEIRFVLGTSNMDQNDIKQMCSGLLALPTPACIRTDTNLKLQMNKANPIVHNATIETIRGIIRTPIKISGNINDVKSATTCESATRFAVSMLQARTIIREFKQQPNEVLKLLDK